MSKSLKLVTVSLRISSVFLIAIAIGCIYLIVADKGRGIGTLVIFALIPISIAFTAFVETVIFNLKRDRYWAWVCGLVIGGIYLINLTIFTPIGILVLVGLLQPSTSFMFSKHKTKSKRIEPAGIVNDGAAPHRD